MASRSILLADNPRLRKKSRRIEEITPRILELLDDLAQTMREEKGLGLAAPQVGILRRVAVVDIGEGLFELINPVIVKTEGQQREEEGCLSVPLVRGIVPRPAKVDVQAQNRTGKKIRLHAEGLLAKAFCHEIDHLDGILFTDKMIVRTDAANEKK